MINANSAIKIADITYDNAHIYETQSANAVNGGLKGNSKLKVRIPNFSGEICVGDAVLYNGRAYAVTLVRYNTNGLNPHCYIECSE